MLNHDSPTGHDARLLEVVIHNQPKEQLNAEQPEDVSTGHSLRCLRALSLIVGAAVFMLGALVLFNSVWNGEGDQGVMAVDQRQILTSLSPDNACTGKVVYVTDAEGDFEWFKKAVQATGIIDVAEVANGIPVLAFNTDSKDACFVYGGDTVDATNTAQAMGGDIRIVTSLNNFRASKPKNVFFILGNRDSNKLRFLREVEGRNAAGDFSDQFKGRGMDFSQWNLENSNCGKQICKLKYILSQTMGAPAAFEMRRKELQHLEKDSKDEDVMNSFLDSVRRDPTKDNFMFQYIKNSAMAVTLGETLFVHAIPKDISTQSVLWKKNQLKDELFGNYDKEGGPAEWDYKAFKDSLDAGFYTEDIRAFIPNTDGAYDKDKADELKKRLMTLMEASNFMVVGHIPLGGSPAIVNVADHKWLVDGDTGVSGGTKKKQRSAEAVPSIAIVGDTMTIAGKLPTLNKDYTVTLSGNDAEPINIGTIENNGLVVADGVLFQANSFTTEPQFEQRYWNANDLKWVSTNNP